jgi:PleD family two-component response regulator
MRSAQNQEFMTAPPHILVVDDDRQVVRYLKKALEENS